MENCRDYPGLSVDPRLLFLKKEKGLRGVHSQHENGGQTATSHHKQFNNSVIRRRKNPRVNREKEEPEAFRSYAPKTVNNGIFEEAFDAISQFPSTGFLNWG